MKLIKMMIAKQQRHMSSLGTKAHQKLKTYEIKARGEVKESLDEDSQDKGATMPKPKSKKQNNMIK
jgi:hypothetical protein